MPPSLATDTFLQELSNLAHSLQAGERRLIAIAGPPGAGKTTLSERLCSALNAGAEGIAAILPMDGYHYDDELLNLRGWRPRKGAPHTFDVGGLAAMLRRLNDNSEKEIAVPRFDRSIEIARNAARIIPHTARLVLVEGNYLLLNDPPWDCLAQYFYLTAMIRVEEKELARRLRERWVVYGLNEAEIRSKLEENDLPNGRFIYAHSRLADFEIISQSS